MQKKSEFVQKALIIFMLSLGAVTILYPLMWTTLASLKTRAEIVAIPGKLLPQEVQWINYKKVIHIISFAVAYKNSLIIALIATTAVLVTSSIGGYAFAKLRFPGRDLIFLIILSTMMVPFFLGSIPLYVLMKWFGWLDSYYALIVPFVVSPFGIFLLRQFILGIPDALVDSARLDGCSEFRVYWSIILPLAKPALGALAIFNFLWAWNDFFWPLLIIQSPKLYTIPIALSHLQIKSALSYELISAGTVISIVPVLIVFLLGQKRITEGVAMTGIKA